MIKMIGKLIRSIWAKDVDWDSLSESLDAERLTKHPKFVSFFESLGLPSYVTGPTDEIEFLPAALAIVEQPPSPASRVIAKTIIAFFVIALLWACIGSVDITAIAQGRIVPTGRTKVIQPLESGVVHAIHVQDGQAVKTGDVLIEIDSTINESERDRLSQEYIESSLNAARLKSALNINEGGATKLVVPTDATEAQIATQQAMLTNQLEEIHAKLHGLDRQIAQQKGNVDAVQSTINKLKESIPFLEQRSEARDYLAQKGYGSKLDSLSTKQDLVEHQQELEVQKGRLAEAMGAVASLQEQRQQAAAEYEHKNLDELAQEQQKASSLHEQLLQAAEKFKLQTLTAPVDGTVQQLAVHTEGGVVTPAQVLMSIVPADSHLEIEAMVSNRDIGFVHAGQEVHVKVDTFNFTKYGLLHGEVISVSQDSVLRDKADKSGDKQVIGAENETSEPKGQELLYAARVALDQTQMQVDDEVVNLIPGMAVTVEIKTGSRHIISYLLSPLQTHMHQSLHER